MYNDMILAYENGANYILVFNYKCLSNYAYGILEEEHLEALSKFWDYLGDNPKKNDSLNDRVAYVLPKDYGFGFRGPNDKIWGIWEADDLSKEIIPDFYNQMEYYGNRLDMIYDDGLKPYNIPSYSRLIFLEWN